ncbi:MAG: hypothetical protein [Olavius algarvensis Gamma 1 endosymbiont]|nr:MAG: hypothetical protein [Olavius algarvensis Gamma 1 endosymbiont]
MNHECTRIDANKEERVHGKHERHGKNTVLPSVFFRAFRGQEKAKLFGKASPWERGRLARIRSTVASGTLLAFSILRACPKPAGCRRSHNALTETRR